MRLKSFLFAALIAFALPAYAIEPQSIPIAGTIHDPNEMPVGLYQLDPTHAHAQFYINHMGFSEYTGDFHNIQGQLVFRKPVTDSKLNVTIDVDSISVQSEELTQTLKSNAFFDAAHFPTITFTSEKLEAISDTRGTLTGDLNMHGVTKPVVLDVTFVGGGMMPMKNVQTMGFTATGNLKRSDFGMTGFLPGLGVNIRLDISAEFNLVDTAAPQHKPE